MRTFVPIGSAAWNKTGEATQKAPMAAKFACDHVLAA